MSSLPEPPKPGPDKDDKLECKICGKSYFQYDMKRHLKTHDPGKRILSSYIIKLWLKSMFLVLQSWLNAVFAGKKLEKGH
jgi:hypothetical protein